MASILGVDGIVSGLDTTSIIEAMVQTQQNVIDKLETKKETYETEESAWREVNSSILALQSAAYNLQSFLQFKSRSATSSNSDILTASAKVGTAVGSYSLEVLNTAKAHSISSSKLAEGTTASASGTIQVGGVDIDISEGDSLETIAAEITQADNGVTASLIQVESGQYQLVLSANETGTENAMTLTDSNGILEGLGLVDSEGNIANEVQAAEDASFKLNGVTITRSSNTVDDVVDGLTLELNSAKAGTTVNVTVSQNIDDIIESVNEFVTQYNSTMDLINDDLSYDSENKIAGTLQGDTTLMRIQSQLQSLVSQTVNGVDSSVSMLPLVGISTGDFGTAVENILSGHLSVDENTLREALTENFDAVASLFGATSQNLALGTSGATISNSNGNNVSALLDGNTAGTATQLELDSWTTIQLGRTSVIDQLNMYTNSGDAENAAGLSGYTVEYWDLTSGEWKSLISAASNSNAFISETFEAVKTNQIRIKADSSNGAAGTDYAELFEVEIFEQNTGVFSEMYSTLYSWTSSDGMIGEAITDYEELITDLDEQISTKEEQLEERMETLYSKFSAMETALSELESMESTITTLLNSLNSDDDD